MLLAHRIPTVLCACIRRHSTSSPTSLLNARSHPPATAAAAICALAGLVHPTGAQWVPIRAMPLAEATIDACGIGATVGQDWLAAEIKAAVDLGLSVCLQTATNLLENAPQDSSDVNHSGVSGDLGSTYQNGRHEEERHEPHSTTAIEVLCGILCSEGKDGHGGGSVGVVDLDDTPNRANTAPFCDQSVSRYHDRREVELQSLPSPSPSSAGGRLQVTLAALRLLLHACRASSGVAHAIADYDGGTVVQALLKRLCFTLSANEYSREKVMRRSVCLTRLGGVATTHDVSHCFVEK